MNEEKAVGAELSWDSDKNLEDFRVIGRNLFDEKQLSRARAVFYLIERAKMAENRESEKDAQHKQEMDEAVRYLRNTWRKLNEAHDSDDWCNEDTWLELDIYIGEASHDINAFLSAHQDKERK